MVAVGIGNRGVGHSTALVELLGEDVVDGELQPPDATLRRALSQRREVDGGSEGE